MPEVRNDQSRAKDFQNGGWRGRVRRANRACSRFVLAAAIAVGLIGTGAVELTVRISLAPDLPTGNGPELSVSRASEAAAKRKDTAQASSTPCWRQFNRA